MRSLHRQNIIPKFSEGRESMWEKIWMPLRGKMRQDSFVFVETLRNAFRIRWNVASYFPQKRGFRILILPEKFGDATGKQADNLSTWCCTPAALRLHMVQFRQSPVFEMVSGLQAPGYQQQGSHYETGCGIYGGDFNYISVSSNMNPYTTSVFTSQLSLSNTPTTKVI